MVAHRIVLLILLLIAGWLRLEVLGGTTLEGAFRADDRSYLTYAINVDRFGVYSTTLPNGDTPPPADTVRPPGLPALSAGPHRC